MVQVGPVYFVHPVPDAFENRSAFRKGLYEGFFLMGPPVQLVFVVSIGFKLFDGN